VDDALTWRQWFVNRFGFGSAGSWQDDDSHHERVCSGSVRFLLSSARSAASPVARYLALHPPGVVDVALRVQNLAALLQRAKALGAAVVSEHDAASAHDAAIDSLTQQVQPAWAKISGWGALQHTLVELSSTQELPPQLRWAVPRATDTFQHIDHVVLNVAAGALEQAVQWYSELLGLRSRQSFHIRTPYSGLRSQVLVGDSPRPNGNPLLQFPINEPESPTSQIQDFLDRNHGPGIQHIALGTQTLLSTVAELRQQQIDFLAVPPSYYRQLPLRPQFAAQGLGANWADIVAQQVLVDWHPERLEGPLLQIFTRPIFAEPTFFFELIERRQAEASPNALPTQDSAAKHNAIDCHSIEEGVALNEQATSEKLLSAGARSSVPSGSRAQGFGEGNFQALFEAMELEQRSRALLSKP